MGTIRVLYFTLVRSILECGCVIWSPWIQDHIKSLERTQNRFLKHLYCKDFGYYEPMITYNELVLGYEMTTRGGLAALLLLRDIINSKTNSPKLLEKIYFHIPSRVNCERRNIFYIQSARTNHFSNLPLNRAPKLYGKGENLDHTVDIFCDSRSAFKSNVLEAS